MPKSGASSGPSDEERQIGLESVLDGTCKRSNRFSVPKVPLHLDEDKVFEAATDYQNWNFNFRFTLTNLPPFDNSAIFGITQAAENEQIKEEIKKFIHFLESDKPPLFSSYGALQGTNITGYTDLFNIVDQIKSNLQVIRHDNACLAFDHYLQPRFYDIIDETKTDLRRRYLREPRGIVGHNPILLDDKTKNVQAYHALVDYVFHSLAWWLMHAAEHKAWHAPIVAVLARWSVKLKVIALDPVRWAEQSLAKAEDIMRRINEQQKEGERVRIEIQDFGVNTEPKKKDCLENFDLDYYYYLTKTRIRHILFLTIAQILDNLLAETSNRKGSTAFEVRTLLYRDDLDQKLRQLTVGQDGSVATSSDRKNLRYSYRALQLLISNIQRIPPADAEKDSAEATRILWSIKLGKGEDIERGSVTTARLDDVISALVPVGMMASAAVVTSLAGLATWLGTDDDMDPLPGHLELAREENPRIEFSLSTRRREKDGSNNAGFGVVSTSMSPLIASMQDVVKEIESNRDFDANAPENVLKVEALRTFQEYEARKEEIDSWALTEDSVRVHTTKYSTGIISIAICIIAGTFSIPFTVAERLPGVDPFQFATFGWLLAGAFLVGAKSRYVENWPWHDFLRGQIVCRSVSELAVASRVKKQAVLLYLLHKEFRNPLLFRGPCRGPFNRLSESSAEGFSIDVAVEHSTILAAGFIVLEVRTDEMSVHTVLHDTREGRDTLRRHEMLMSCPREGILSEAGERRKLSYKEEIRLKPKDRPINFKVVGLLTADCIFV